MEATLEMQGTVWRQRWFGRNPRRTLCRVWIWTAAVNVILHSMILPIAVSGSSMSPTYSSGARNLVNKLSYFRHPPRRGDVVVIQLQGEDELLIKRIVGLPGEAVGIHNGDIQVNGRPLRDAYAAAKIPWESPTLRLRQNEFFFIGDNRANSVYGVVRKDQIVGRVIF